MNKLYLQEHRGAKTRNLMLCLVLLSFVFFIAAGDAQAQQSKPFGWSLALQNMKSSDLVPFSAPIQSWTGEQFRIVINPESAIYCYVVVESPGDEVGVLYSGPLKSGETWLSQVMELAPPKGEESLYIVASHEEQKTLAQRIAAFNANAGSTQKRALMTEIFRIRSEGSKFKEAPEKPVLMGGASRGTPDKSQGVQYSGLDTYVKTISIQH